VTTSTPRDRALAAFYGLAIGDALGMPTQELPRSRAREILALSRFEDAPHDQRISAHLRAGTVTDDTEQALVVARLLVEGQGRVDAHVLAQRLLDWESDVTARGSLDLLGPSTRRALAAVADGVDPLTTGSSGATDGAAMRITPVGIATPPEPVMGLVDAVVALDLPTHDTGIAHAGAAAVAAMVSHGVAGSPVSGSLPRAVEAARLAQDRGHWVAGPSVSARIVWAVDLVRTTSESRGAEAALDAVDRLVGTSLLTQEAVPAAFAVTALHAHDPWAAVRAAAALGGDSDTIAAMVGAMVGAANGMSGWPDHALATVRRVNSLALEPLVESLLVLRSVGASRSGAQA